MAKFTKLNIGDTVASGSGRAWKKLSTNLTPQLSAPTISLDGTILTITEDSGLATSFDILVDGEVKGTATGEKYLYNGVSLPPIPECLLADYPYAWIRNNTTTGYYDLVLAAYPWYYNTNMYCSGGTSVPLPWYQIAIATADTATEWIFNQNTTGNFGIDTARTVLWSNHDIPNGSADATDIYFEGTEPMPIPIGDLNYTFAMTFLGLSAGTYSITAKAKAEGYVDSTESNVISYVATAQDVLIGTWVFGSDVSSAHATDGGLYFLLYSNTMSSNVVATLNSPHAGEFNITLELSANSIYYGILFTYNGNSWAQISKEGGTLLHNTTVNFFRNATLTIYHGDYLYHQTILTWLQANATKIS